MLLISCLLLFAVLSTAITWFGYRRYARPGRVYEQVGVSSPVILPVVDQLSPGQPALPVYVIQKIGAQVPLSPAGASVIRRDLMAAGFRSSGALYFFQGLRVVCAAALLAVALLFAGNLTRNAVLTVVIPVAAAFIGFFGPTFVLDYLIARRHDALRAGLPDALDLMVVAVEAGVGLDEAIQRVAHELATTHKVISDELDVVTLEIRAGKRRSEALHNLGERTGESEIRKLVAILVQTDRFGTSIAESLRVHSDFMRTKRRQDAEERAGKVGVKLVFPIFFLILPAMMVVAAGPGLLQVFRYLFPLMRQFRPGG